LASAQKARLFQDHRFSLRIWTIGILTGEALSEIPKGPPETVKVFDFSPFGGQIFIRHGRALGSKR
jgi:hypothetical protein